MDNKKQQNEIRIITPVGSSHFTIPIDFPKTIYLDVYGKSYTINSIGDITEEVKNE